jgi:hypothetical protein
MGYESLNAAGLDAVTLPYPRFYISSLNAGAVGGAFPFHVRLCLVSEGNLVRQFDLGSESEFSREEVRGFLNLLSSGRLWVAAMLLGDVDDSSLIRGAIDDSDTVFEANLNGVRRALFWSWRDMRGRSVDVVTILVVPCCWLADNVVSISHWRSILSHSRAVARILRLAVDSSWNFGSADDGTARSEPMSVMYHDGSVEFVRRFLENALLPAFQARFPDGAPYIGIFEGIELVFPAIRVQHAQLLLSLLFRSAYSVRSVVMRTVVGRTPLQLFRAVFPEDLLLRGVGNSLSSARTAYSWLPEVLVIDHLALVGDEFDFGRLRSALSAVVQPFYGVMSLGFPSEPVGYSLRGFAHPRENHRLIRYDFRLSSRPFAVTNPLIASDLALSMTSFFRDSIHGTSASGDVLPYGSSGYRVGRRALSPIGGLFGDDGRFLRLSGNVSVEERDGTVFRGRRVIERRIDSGDRTYVRIREVDDERRSPAVPDEPMEEVGNAGASARPSSARRISGGRRVFWTRQGERRPGGSPGCG